MSRTAIQLILAMTTPFLITVVRTRKRRPARAPSARFRRLQRQYLRDESFRWLVIELLCFGLLGAVSAWPLFQALKALGSL